MPAAAATGPHGQEGAAAWQAIGTSVHLIVTQPAALEPACRMLHADLAAVDAACSRFRADSEVVALDRVPQWRGRTGPVKISPLLAEALGVALRAARATDGDVDPTVGGAMSAANELPRIVPPGSASRSTGCPAPKSRNTRPPGTWNAPGISTERL